MRSNLTRRRTIGGIAAGVPLTISASAGLVSAQPTPKTFVLVHGAFFGGWVWRRVSDLLEKSGHKVFSPTLTGLGERSHLLSKDINLDTHITDLVNVVKWESLDGLCLVAHSYAGFPASGALEQIADRVSSIVWLDAFKPNDGERVVDFLNDAARQPILSAFQRGELALNGPKATFVLVNENDGALFDSKATPHPLRTFLDPIKLSGAREKVAKKTFIRIPRLPSPAFDKALADCQADKSWQTLELTDSGHMAMLDAPGRLTDLLLQAA